jgi:hypothetical protein
MDFFNRDPPKLETLAAVEASLHFFSMEEAVVYLLSRLPKQLVPQVMRHVNIQRNYKRLLDAAVSNWALALMEQKQPCDRFATIVVGKRRIFLRFCRIIYDMYKPFQTCIQDERRYRVSFPQYSVLVPIEFGEIMSVFQPSDKSLFERRSKKIFCGEFSCQCHPDPFY